MNTMVDPMMSPQMQQMLPQIPTDEYGQWISVLQPELYGPPQEQQMQPNADMPIEGPTNQAGQSYLIGEAIDG